MNLHVFTPEDVTQHNAEGDLYIIIDGLVFDVSKFDHPGGLNTLLSVAGRDATKEFYTYHDPDVLTKFMSQLCIGRMEAYETPLRQEEAAYAQGGFGRQQPFADPYWYRVNWHSPYYKESHRDLRSAIREIVEREIIPNVKEWEKLGHVPKSVYRRVAQKGLFVSILATRCSVSLLEPESRVSVHEHDYHLESIDNSGEKLPLLADVPVEEWNAFHEQVIFDEFSRCGSAGVCWALLGGIYGGLPPIIQYGSEYLQDTVMKRVLRGDAIISLAISEPYCGADAAGVRTVAAIEPDGKSFIVNGEKKWIPNALTADFFTVAVRTRNDLVIAHPEDVPAEIEENSIVNTQHQKLVWNNELKDPVFSTDRPTSTSQVSLLVIPSNLPGITIEPINCGGAYSAGLGLIRMHNVRVPVEYLVGVPNMGLTYALHNFNHERWMFAIFATRFARICIEEAFRWSLRRNTFGAALISHAVIRANLAQSLKGIEASQSAIENLTFQLVEMTPQVALRALIAPIALAKSFATSTMEEACKVSSRVMGSAGYAQGSVIDRLTRDLRAISIPAGSEEILADLAVRIAVRDAHNIGMTRGLSHL